MFCLVHGFASLLLLIFKHFISLSVNYLRGTVEKAAVNDNDKGV